MTSETTKKEQRWLRPEGKKNKISSGLYLVSTPIGNLSDISLRALDVLAASDYVVCEDTRVTKKLLSHYGLQADLLKYNDHSDDKQRAKILSLLKDGNIVSLVSDAGTPLVSDPGYKLVRDILDAGLYVTSLPGANAVLPALQLSGQPSDKFCFLGFMPNKAGQRETLLKQWKVTDAPLIFYETAPRLLPALEAIEKILGEREIAVVREITKMFEESRRGKVSELITHYKANDRPKGEIVLIVGPGAHDFSENEIDRMLTEALTSHGTKEAAGVVSDITGRSKKELYQRALEINGSTKE